MGAGAVLSSIIFCIAQKCHTGTSRKAGEELTGACRVSLPSVSFFWCKNSCPNWGEPCWCQPELFVWSRGHPCCLHAPYPRLQWLMGGNIPMNIPWKTMTLLSSRTALSRSALKLPNSGSHIAARGRAQSCCAAGMLAASPAKPVSLRNSGA